MQPAADRPDLNSAASGLDAGWSRNLVEFQAAPAGFSLELAIALEHNDGAPAGFEHHGLAVANAQTPAARAGGNATSRGVDMNAAAAGRDLNITAHFADLDRPATAGSGDRAADLVEMNASAAGRDIYSAVQALRGDCAALRLQHHRCCLLRR